MAQTYDPKRHQLKIFSWPPHDRALWEGAMLPGSIWEDGGSGEKWRPATRITTAKGYGRWLTWLVHSGGIRNESSPCSRATPERVAAYIDDLREQVSSQSVKGYILALAMALGVMEPNFDLAWLWEVVNRLQRRVVRSSRKDGRILPAQEIGAFGLELMDKAETDPDINELTRACLFRDGLMIALLIARPVRLKNFSSIEIGRQLTTRAGRSYLRFSEAETKTRNFLEFQIPTALESYLLRYITTYRPRLISRKSDDSPNGEGEEISALWVSGEGNKMAYASINCQITDRTRRKFGKSLNPHLFRDCAATSIAEEDRNHCEMTMTILGHTTLATSERYYVEARRRKASNAYQLRILALSRKATREPTMAPRK